MPWNPDQYHKFQAERSAPFNDLLTLVEIRPHLKVEKVYAHVLENADAIVEWVSGTALVPYFERLGSHKDAYLNALRAKMCAALPGSPVFYPFKRTLFSAQNPAA
jgi:trans-aconitate 2-methyltransferase